MKQEDIEKEIISHITTWINDVLIKGILSTAHADRFRILKGSATAGAPPVPGILTVRSGKLLGALSPKGNEYSIRNIIRENWVFKLDWGVQNLAYAEIHERGGRIPVTPKSRRFFWYKFKETGDVKWKKMAISKKQFFTMPPRPYFYPAVEEAKGKIEQSAKRMLEDLMQNLIKKLET